MLLNYRLNNDMKNIEHVIVLPPNPGAVKREIPISMQRDEAIRSAMLEAVTSPLSKLYRIGEFIVENEAMPLLDSTVDFPFRLPEPVVGVNDVGSNNREMRKFAYDTYDCLHAHFGEEPWTEWDILGHVMPREEPTHIHLGVFIGLSDLIRTVVE